MSEDRHGGEADKPRPTPQGLGAQGPGNTHGTPSDHEPDTEGRPFSPQAGQPAQDPQEMAGKVLNRANTGPEAAGDGEPEAAGKGG